MTKLEIIEELFDNGYIKDPSTSALIHGFCEYEIIKENGTILNCAVGKCLTRQGIEYAKKNDIAGVDEFENLEFLLQEKYQGHSIDFWMNLQIMHDGRDFWTLNSITEVGKSELNRLKKLYA